MSEAFNGRLEYGTAWDNEVASKLKESKYEIARYGIEHVGNHFTKNSAYFKCENPSIRFARYFPDGLAADFSHDVAFFWDAKIGASIERDAYETYCGIAGNSREFYLFIKEKQYSKKYCVPLTAVEFLDSMGYVSKFSEQNQMPVVDGWIAPRAWPEDKYLKWKLNHPEASGTPFKYFNFALMDCWKYEWPFNYAHVKAASIIKSIRGQAPLTVWVSA